MTQTAVATKLTQAEAYEQKIQIAQAGVKQIRENVFSVPSFSESAPHIVTTDEQGNATYCSCKWFSKAGWRLHKCCHAQGTERFVAAQKVVEQAEEVIKQSQQVTPEQAQIEAYIAQGVSYSTAERIVNAKGVKSHGNAKGYQPQAFSLYR